MDNMQGQLEESYVRQTLSVNSLRDRQIAANSTAFESDISRAELSIDKALLQLIQTACKADKLSRALDLATLLTSTNSIESAAQIANFYHLPGLKEKISALREVKEDELDDRDDADRRRKENGSRWGAGGAGRYVPQITKFDYVTGNAHLPPRTELYARTVPDFAPRPVGGRKGLKAGPTYSPAPMSAPSSRFTLNSEPADHSGLFVPDSPPADEQDEMDYEVQDLQDDEDDVSGAKRRRDADDAFDMAGRKKRVSIGSAEVAGPAIKARESLRLAPSSFFRIRLTTGLSTFQLPRTPSRRRTPTPLHPVRLAPSRLLPKDSMTNPLLPALHQTLSPAQTSARPHRSRSRQVSLTEWTSVESLRRVRPVSCPDRLFAL